MTSRSDFSSLDSESLISIPFFCVNVLNFTSHCVNSRKVPKPKYETSRPHDAVSRMKPIRSGPHRCRLHSSRDRRGSWGEPLDARADLDSSPSPAKPHRRDRKAELRRAEKQTTVRCPLCSFSPGFDWTENNNLNNWGRWILLLYCSPPPEGHQFKLFNQYF